MAAEAVVSFVIERLGELLLNEANFLYGVGDLVEEARSELQRIKDFLEDADARARKGDKAIHGHVAEIREAAYDLEDVIATFALKVASRSDRGRIYILKRIPCILINLHKVGKEVERICAKISKSRSTFIEVGVVLAQSRDEEVPSSSTERLLRDPRRTSDNPDSDFVGFGEDIKKLVSDLTIQGSRHKVVSICGIGGLGKTTLARQIYHHDNVRGHFHHFAWAYVSEKCQPRDVWEQILNMLLSSNEEEEQKIKYMSVHKLSKKLCNILKEKKCLVILDDIWNNATWDSLKFAFPNGTCESKLLFTTRDTGLGSYADQHGILHNPEGLKDKESWELLRKAYSGENVADFEVNKMKRNLAQEMLDLCGGLPLAITVLGRLLRNVETITEWNTLHNDIKTLLTEGESNKKENSNSGVRPVLGLSYNGLPYHLKPCLLSLASFPEGIKIRAKELYRLWMAEGFVSDENEAYKRLSELVERCIVHVAERGSTGRIKTCRIHALMREFCLSKAKEEKFLEAVDLCRQNLRPADKFRRLAIYLDNNTTADELLSLIRNKDACLRSLMCFNPRSSQLNYDQIMKTLLRRFRLLRVLKFEKLKIGELPKEIGDLVHLRLFSLRDSYVEYLPSAIGNLRCLQTLDLRLRQSFLSGSEEQFVFADSSQEQFEIPSSICKLEQIRHLYLPGFWRKTLSLDNLVKLQTLVNAFANDKFLDGLEKLTSLVKLKINLALDFKGAGISFEKLQSLAIVYPGDSDLKIDFTERVTSVISNCPEIDKLHLGVHLVKLPEDNKFSPNLTKLTLIRTRLEEDPMAMLEKLPNLRILLLDQDSYRGTEMVCKEKGFPELVSLSICSLHSLDDWKVENGALPRLHHLHIEWCLELGTIPDGMRHVLTLKEIVIKDMPEKFKNRIDKGGEDHCRVERVPSLAFIDCNWVAGPDQKEIRGQRLARQN